MELEWFEHDMNGFLDTEDGPGNGHSKCGSACAEEGHDTDVYA